MSYRQEIVGRYFLLARHVLIFCLQQPGRDVSRRRAVEVQLNESRMASDSQSNRSRAVLQIYIHSFTYLLTYLLQLSGTSQRRAL